jgi:hypothetical protein
MKVAILGSCVTKQPFECMESGVYVLPNPVLYDARTSLISLTTDPLEPVDRWLALCNEWEGEWMLRDFRKSFWTRLPHDLDVLVMDLVDERLDLLRSDGSYKVEAPEIEKWRVRGNAVEGVGFSHVPRVEADGLWEDAARLFFPRLRSTAPGARILVHRAFFAVQGGDGEIDFAWLRWSVQMNAMLERYYDVISRVAPDVTFVEAPPALRRQKHDHKYGPAPFHFIDEYDMAVARSVRDLIGAGTARSVRGRDPRGGAEPARRTPTRRPLDWNACPQPTAGIEIKAGPEGYVVYHPAHDRGHYLNHTAALVLGFCDGQVRASELAALLQAAYRLTEAPVGEVAQCLEKLFEEGLIH